MKNNNKLTFQAILKDEKNLIFVLLTTMIFFFFGTNLLNNLANPLWFGIIIIWLFAIALLAAFAIVRHAESLAEILGEPLGTLILTLSVIGIEVAMISAVMLTGEDNPTVARDTMFAVIMIVLNGMVGISLLLGGWRHYEQDYNIKGANAFLSLIVPLAILGLVLPTYTKTTNSPTFSNFQAIVISIMSIGLYAIFLVIQNKRHKDFFIGGENSENQENHHHDFEVRTLPYHIIFLLAYLSPLVFLAKKLAIPINFGITKFGFPIALGGFLIAVLILSPEAMSAIKAAKRDDLQRSINLSLGSVLASIGLTIPTVLTIGLITGKTVILGLDAVDTVMLVLSLIISLITFRQEQTNILLGSVHLLLFFAYLMLIFES